MKNGVGEVGDSCSLNRFNSSGTWIIVDVFRDDGELKYIIVNSSNSGNSLRVSYKAVTFKSDY